VGSVFGDLHIHTDMHQDPGSSQPGSLTRY
jgi:hypothetical protein